MRIHTDTEFARFAALLARPDPPEMPPRRHRWTCIGDYQRRTKVLIPLWIKWLQTRHVLREEGDVR